MAEDHLEKMVHKGRHEDMRIGQGPTNAYCVCSLCQMQQRPQGSLVPLCHGIPRHLLNTWSLTSGCKWSAGSFWVKVVLRLKLPRNSQWFLNLHDEKGHLLNIPFRGLPSQTPLNQNLYRRALGLCIPNTPISPPSPQGFLSPQKFEEHWQQR